MSANDKTEKVLRELHILLSKSEPYKKEPTKVIVDKQKMLINVYMKYRMSMNLQNKAEPTQKENSVKKVIR